MGDLGNNPCKCAVLLDAWRNDKTKDNTQVHDEFKRERMVPDKLAMRLLRQKNRRRNWPDIDVVYGKLSDPYTERIGYASSNYHHDVVHSAADTMSTFVVETVYKTLLHRGWPAEMFDYADDSRQIVLLDNKGKNMNTSSRIEYAIFRINESRGYYTPYCGGELIPDSSINDEHTKETIPWRMFIDTVEAKIFKLILDNRGHDQLVSRKEQFEKLAGEAVGKMGMLPKHSEVTIQKHNGSLTLKIEHTGLTQQAANLLVRHYRKTQPRVKRLLKYNMVRRRQWFRVPAEPSRGFGALC